MSALGFIIICIVRWIQLCSAVSVQEKSAAEAECASILDNDLSFIAGFVRLAFHDCVNGCDGCIDLSNAENNGLERYIISLNESYYNGTKNISSSMSRADFWVTCAAVAVARGHQESGRNDPAPVITVQYGRQTCSSIPTNRLFPDSKKGCTHVFEYFTDSNGFGLTELETIALLGAHTLGEARIPNSGFMGPWVNNKNFLDNNYYEELLRPWNQIENQAGNYQWIRPGQGMPPNLMLNTDICLSEDISPNVTFGENAVKETNNIGAATTVELVRRFADDNADWLEQFGLVFTKMISKTASGETLEDVTGVLETTTSSSPIHLVSIYSLLITLFFTLI